MEASLRVALIVAVVGFGLWVAKYIHEHPVDAELDRLEAEVLRLEEANAAIREENERYRTLVRGLREDPRVLERRARETLGLARDGEFIIMFEEGGAASSGTR